MRVLIFLLLVSTAAAQDLEQLKYNNPGLEVDLGVGLWAWPMPMDYDGDGDFDLVVACPDKPSNGVWFFENPSDDPKVKMPVFKAGVRLGPAGHNMQVSYVDGEARVLREGEEYVDFRENGFEKKEKIYPRSKIHPGKTRANMWRYVDWEGDGDQDLIVGVGDWSDYGWDHAYDAKGRWQNGPLHGWVYLIETLENGHAEPRKIEAGGVAIDVYGWPSPSFADFDGDGDLDLICGEFLDGFTYFENQGTREEPAYASGKRLRSDFRDLTMDLQMITPVALDWDRDGDVDLVCGDEDGRVALIENRGRMEEGAPSFESPRYFRQEADTLKFGALSTPFAFDIDQDGDEDIVCGNTAGYIGVFENLGSSGEAPKFGEVELLGSIITVKNPGTPVVHVLSPLRLMAGPNGSIQGPAEAKWGYTTLSVHNNAILANSIHGDVLRITLGQGPPHSYASAGVDPQIPNIMDIQPVLLKSDSDDLPEPAWSWADTVGGVLKTQWRTTPLSLDENHIVMLDHEGFLAEFEVLSEPKTNPQTPFGPSLPAQTPEPMVVDSGVRIFVDEDNNPIRLNKRSAGSSGRFKLAATDWDGDGRVDFLVNSENAIWYRNCEDRNGKIVLKKIGNLAKRKVSGHTSSPAVCDFDGDGKPDLLVGAEDGRIYFAKHDDCIKYTGEQLLARPPVPPAPMKPGIVKEEFVFTKAKFPQCHASTICANSRGLVCAWFGGTHEKAKDVGIWVSYNDGAGWTAPLEAANGIQYEGHRHPCWNPVLFQTPGDQETLLFFKVGPDPANWWGEAITSYDRGRTWRDRRRLPEGIDGPVKNKPILLDDGTLLCGSSTENEGWRVHFELTKDFGKSWTRIGPINDASKFNAIQPTILRYADGRLQILCRSQEGKIVTAWSKDQGQTWSAMEATDLPNPNAGFDGVTLADGRQLLVYNHTTRNEGEWRGRSQLNLAVSSDGLKWTPVLTLEQEKGAEFSYPAIMQTADGLVHTTYTWKRERIKHVVIDPKQLRAD
ncbi:MAG: putative neuraminidase [Verrucomicrobiales bacterium]|jgi:predicted neuraminidase